MNLFDTITALSTPVGTGGIAVIRVSGEEAIDITDKIFKPRSGKSLREYPYRTAVFGAIFDQEGVQIDEVLVTAFAAPFSFTGEDMTEISCHGSMAVVKLILKQLIEQGARTALNGEYTKRAFLNGKLDLSQAEAVIDLIHAEDEINVYSAERQLKGALKERIFSLRTQLIDTVSNVLAVIDYPEEDIDEMEISGILKVLSSVREEINALKETYRTGKIIKEGAKIVIAGRPNVGKSSLLNALLKENRAIVTDIAGTTRDILEESLSLDGLKARIIDTAGIRESDDQVESLGIARAMEQIKTADLVLLVLDQSQPLREEDLNLCAQLKDFPVFALFNKSDLSSMLQLEEIKTRLPQAEFFEISAQNFAGIPALTTAMKTRILEGEIRVKEQTYITNERQFEELNTASHHITRAIDGLSEGMFPDLVTIDIEHAITALGGITGETVSEEIISNIFSKFCLGK